MLTEPISRRKALGLTGALLAAAACRPDSLFSPSRPTFASAQFEPITLIGAGDAHVRGASHNSHATGALIRRVLDADPTAYALALGDNAGDASLEADFQRYDLAWGSFKSRTLPLLGNHEYKIDPTASAYFDYYGSNAGERGQGWYAKTLGAWRCYFLNYYRLRGEQTAWLAEDLLQYSHLHKAAFTHVPMFASDCAHAEGSMARPKQVGPWWSLLQQHKAEVMVVGHAHRYERFAPMLRDGTRSSNGIRQFLVGTGGGTLMPNGAVHPYSQRRYVGCGVMQLTLHPDRYAWRFTDIGGIVRDQGEKLCRSNLV